MHKSMRPKLPEEGRRQKLAGQATYRNENVYNPEATPQYFQISVNVLEARKLAWNNPQSANSYVIAAIDKKKHRTSVRKNMPEPFYKENFVFDIYTSICEIQEMCLWLAVMEPRCCAPPRLLGEASIGLASIWSQKHHQVFHKWAQLCMPRDPAAGPVGFLKVDISIIYRGELQLLPVLTGPMDEREDTLLLPIGSEQQRANYLITIYSAFGLPNGTHCHGDKRYGKAPSTFIKVSFCGLVAKTAVQQRSNQPMYCEQISMVEMFPNMNQLIRFEVCSVDGGFNKVLASTHLKLGQLSHDGENGFLPTFGPSLLHMYGNACSNNAGVTSEEGPFHRGALVVALKTVVPYYKQGIRTTNVEPVPHIRPENHWVSDDFCIFCPITEVSMIDNEVVSKTCGIAVAIGEVYCEQRADEEFLAMMEEIRHRKLHYTGCLEVTRTSSVYGHIDFPHAFPVLQLASRLPDFRFRMYRNNMVYSIAEDIETVTRDIEQRLDSCDYASPNDLLEELNQVIEKTANSIKKFLDQIYYPPLSNNFLEVALRQCGTELDFKQQSLQKDEMIKIHKSLTKRLDDASDITLAAIERSAKDTAIGTKKLVKLLLTDTKAIAQLIKNLLYKASEGWPDIVVWLLSGGSRVGFAKLSASDIIYSSLSEQSGKNCGKIRPIFIKPLKCPKHVNTLPNSCFCVAAKVEMIAWMGSFREKSAFGSFLPFGYNLKVRDNDMCIRTPTMMLECRAFIYRAKIFSANDTPIHSFLRINFMNSLKETQVKRETLTPVWNQVLKVQRLQFANHNRLRTSPPTVLVEVNHSSSEGIYELLGNFQMQPVIDDRLDYEYAPKLKWYDMMIGAETTGQVLMSVQILQVPEKLLKTTIYSPIEESFFASGVKDFDNAETIEPLPSNLIPKYSSYKVDIYWWGLRDVSVTRKPCVVLEIEDLTLKSDIITEKRNSCNFPNGRSSQTFEAPLDQGHCPPLSLRLYDSSTFGRTMFFGTYVVKNPMKYYVNWLPKDEREESLKRASIMSSSFIEVRQSLFVRKSSRLTKGSTESISNTAIPAKTHVKPRKWRRLFSRREPEEEEYTLLPMFMNKENNTTSKEVPTREPKDWWMRYLRSQKECIGEDRVNASDKISIYESELELQTEFSKFKDWCSTIKLYNGNKTGIPERDEQLHCGYLKAGIVLYKWPPPSPTIAVSSYGVELNGGYYDDYPPNEPTKFLVRVYLVKACNIKSKDFTGKSSPYAILSCGVVGSLQSDCGGTAFPDILPSSSNALALLSSGLKGNYGSEITGKRDRPYNISGMYEFSCTLPEDYLLTVSLYDFDHNQADELIGTTDIDLEDRIYSKHRARVGLSIEYNMIGPNKWRDCMKPSAVLEELCRKNHIPAPIYPDSATVLVNGVEYKDNEKDTVYGSPVERRENICLTLLHNWHTLPICGYHLVPEHIETRTLRNPAKPGTEMGKLQMWIDIFPLNVGVFIPSPVDITPRKVEEFELRVIILNVNEIEFNRDNTKKKTSDIYVRAWIGSIEQVQHTDAHCVHHGGVCNFNWRMVFNFQYQHTEGKLVTKEKGPFDEVEERIPPVLIIQVLDGDAKVSDDFLGNELGSLHLNLNCMPRGVNLAQTCNLDTMEKTKKISLFVLRNVRSWWPLKLIDRNTGNDMPAGSIEMELTLMPKETAILMPLDIGRETACPFVRPMCQGKKKTMQNNAKAKLGKHKTKLIAWCICTLVGLASVSYFLNIPEYVVDFVLDYGG